jgi:hypothetical protein
MIKGIIMGKGVAKNEGQEDHNKTLAVKESARVLTAAEFHRLSEVPRPSSGLGISAMKRRGGRIGVTCRTSCTFEYVGRDAKARRSGSWSWDRSHSG